MTADQRLRLICIREAQKAFSDMADGTSLTGLARTIYLFVTEQSRAQEKKEAERVGE